MDLIFLLLVIFVFCFIISGFRAQKKESTSKGPLNQHVIHESLQVIAFLRGLIATAKKGGSIYIVKKADSIYISGSAIDDMIAWCLKNPEALISQTPALTRAESFAQRMNSALEEAKKETALLSPIADYRVLGIDYSLKNGYDDWVFFEKWLDTPGASTRHLDALYSELLQAYPGRVSKDQYGGISM